MLPVQWNSQPIQLEGSKSTYAAAVEILAAGLATNPTDIFQILGASTKTIKITRFIVTADATSAGSVDFYLVKRTAANTGGTVAPVTSIAYDSLDPAASAVVQTYSANPSALGAGANILAEAYALPAASSTGYPFFPLLMEFGPRNTKLPTLRGVNESLCLNFGGQAVPAGLDVWISIEWTEEP